MTNILCTICARGGSKGVPNKNIKDVGGKSLVGHAITDIRRWEREPDIAISTDSEEIAAVAEGHRVEVPFRRPEELATDQAAKLPVIKHAAEWMESDRADQYKYVVDIDVTTPLRKPRDIENCFSTVLQDEQATNSYTVCEADKNPYFNMVELDEDGYASLSKDMNTNIIRRQDAPTVYEMNAAVYVFERDFLMNTDSVHGDYTRISVMPEERSVDIDTKLDLEFVRFLFEQQGDVL